MSAVLGSYTSEMDASYAADFGRDREPMKTRSRHPEYRRKGSAPTRVSGMHCRRNKRWTWGSGRGARMLNVRAFAGCLAVALAAAASSAHADFVKIAGGNAAQTTGANAGLGSVSYDYWMSRTETTVAEYAAFLNSQAKADPFSLYNSSMPTIGLTQGGSSGNFTYSVTAGMANRPIAFVDLQAAVRFANWTTSGTMTTGAYTISGGSFSRTGSGYVIPTASEWYKAGFYNPTLNSGSGGYSAYPTSSGSLPASLAASPTPSVLAANYNNVNPTGGPATSADVGSYASTTQSYYGLYDTFGNIAEWSETTASGNARVFSGAWSLPTASVANWGVDGTQTRATTFETSSIGFRLGSTVAPVPEPETLTLAAFGLVGLCGAGWMRRRRSAAGMQTGAAISA